MIRKIVCIAFLGFDSDRIYLPYRKYGAKKLYIIKRRKHDHKVAEYNYRRIRRNVPKRRIHEIIAEDDVFVRVNCLKKIFEKEKGNRIYVNVSTGSKLDAIAGMLAVMLFKDKQQITPFYAHPEKGGRRGKVYFSETTGLDRTQEVYPPDLQKPKNGCHDALRIIFESRHPDRKGELLALRKQEIVEELCKKGCIKGYAYLKGAGFVKADKVKDVRNDLRRHTKKRKIPGLRYYASGAIHSADNNVFRPLKKTWDAIEEEDRPKNKKVSLTKNGKNLCKILFGRAGLPPLEEVT
ncbi:Uncharacterised protein [uncultured archaeon]|nr:Uncharacterised protein [uncultured archaeon]